MMYKYGSPSLIRPPYLPRNCGHIIEVAFGEGGRSKYIDSSGKVFMAVLEKVSSVEGGH